MEKNVHKVHTQYDKSQRSRRTENCRELVVVLIGGTKISKRLSVKESWTWSDPVQCLFPQHVSVFSKSISPFVGGLQIFLGREVEQPTVIILYAVYWIRSSTLLVFMVSMLRK